MSPCPTGTISLSINPNRTFDAYVVSTAVLSTTGVPDSYPRSALVLPGTVVEMTVDGPRPLAGALVTLGNDFPGNYSTTLSDTLGRYLLCTGTPGRGTNQQVPLRVEKDGYNPSSLLVIAGYDAVNVELMRSTISGVVYEYTATGRHPAAGVGLSVISEIADFVVSDANGRYSAFARGGSVAIAAAQPSAYMSPCPTGTPYLNNPNRTFDAAIVSTAVLSTTGMPDSYPITALYLSGTIVEITAEGTRPVAGALVTLGDDFPGNYSTTLSDTLGRFMLCTGTPGLGTDQQMPLRVAKDGYASFSRPVMAVWENGLRVELARKP
jgi:hypothetical protein